MEVHPETGYVYYHVMPRSVVFENIRNSYSAYSQRVPWFHVITPDEFKILQKTDWYQDERNFAITWILIPAGEKILRHAKVACLYMEAFGKDDDLLPDHLFQWNYFKAIAKDYDLLLGHTPSTAAAMSGLGIPVDVLPAGWDPEGLDFSRGVRAKHLVFYGSSAGKRIWSVPRITERLGEHFRDVTGSFGKRALRELSGAKAEVYLAHSNCDSGSTWRVWHVIASGTALMGEPADFWPMVPGLHYTEIPRITEANLDQVVAEIRKILDSDLLEKALQQTWDDLAMDYTLEKVVQKNLVPASMRA